ncbi:MAG TPA: inositol 2-dehydrogenase [Aestuariivirgaceae bacterium]|jgi:myo-inositol 2-dehydrogenase/D-chiro-inositol 1-dehydrogenase
MLGVAVLGAGRIGKIHAGNVALNPRLRLVAVADPVAEAARALAQQLNCEASTDPVATVERADVDAIIIGTPTDTHVDFLLQGAEAGKAVLCEKPVDLDIARAEMAAEKVEELNARVMIGFNRRFDPSAQELKRQILAGKIGDVRQVIITSRDPAPPTAAYIKTSGGVFRDMAIHDFDMARFFLDEEPVEVMAMASSLTEPHVKALGDSDTMMIIMKTVSGKQCHINCYRKAVYGYDQRFEVLGSDGMLQNANLRPTTVRRYTAHETEVQDPILNFFLERYVEAYRSELDLFAEAVQKGTQMPVTVRDGCKALRLADAAVESAATGKSIRV